MTIKRNKKVAIIAAVLAVIMVGAASFAYFSDRVSTSETGTAGSVQLSDISFTGRLLDADRKDILNPGDERDLSFTVTNQGNKSIDVRETLVLEAFEADGTTPKNFTATGQAEYEIYLASDVEADGQGSYAPKDGATPIATRTLDRNKITYTPAHYTLNGKDSQDPHEVETGITSDSKANPYVLVFKGASDNSWQTTKIKVSALVEAIQHRNVQDNDAKWTTVRSESITLGASTYDVVPTEG